MIAQKQPQSLKSIPWANLILGVLLWGVFASLLVFLVLKLVSTKSVPMRLITTSCTVGLFFAKFLAHLKWGPKGFDKKMRTFGADLTFASVSFDITTASGQIPVQNLLSLWIPNPVAFCIIAGVVTIITWAVFHYPNTVVEQDPSPWYILGASTLGVVFYFVKLFLYF